MSDLIKIGDVVVIRLHDEVCCYMVKVEGDQKIGRSRVSVKNMIGYPYGSIFEICDRKLKYINIENNEETTSFESCYKDQEGGDNRGYADTNTAQKLTDEDIQKLRASGASSSEIIQSLISNSDTWAAKTVFAQEKWMKKKQQKYAKRFRVLKSSPSTICEVYSNKNKERVCGMRNDTLAQIMYQSSVHSGSKILVFESTLGLIVGAVAYQLRGCGLILATYEGQQPHFELVDAMNLDDKSISIIQPVPSSELAPAVDDVKLHGFSIETDPDEDINISDPPIQLQSLEEVSVTENRSFSATGEVEKRERGDSVDVPPKKHNMSGRQMKDLLRVRQLLRQGVNR
jgi:tRNA (adenine-N(1)-)-methyltransferase non-catalytic subunit